MDTVYKQGWSTLENGELIKKADLEHYDCFGTTDKNLEYQQNLSERNIAIAVLPTLGCPVLNNHGNRIAEEIGMLKKNDFHDTSLEPGI